MPAEFGVVAIPQHFQQEDGVDLDALLPHIPRRSFHDERNPPSSWSEDTLGVAVDLIRFPSDLLDRMPGLKVLSFAGTGVGDWVDVAHATSRGIAVCNVPDWGNDAIAEYTFGLVIAVARKMFAADAMARTTDWQEEKLRSIELRGLTMGLLGLGNIGQRVAEIAEGFGMKVLAHTRNPDRPRTTTANVEYVSLDDLLRRSNVLSLNVKLNDETRGMIGARELDLLPPNAILVNTARGQVVDTDALVAALKSKKLWGAGLDVFDEEPIPEHHPLKELDNVVLAPHAAGQTDAAKRKVYISTVRNLDNFAIGQPTNVLNPEALGR